MQISEKGAKIALDFLYSLETKTLETCEKDNQESRIETIQNVVDLAANLREAMVDPQ